MNNWIDELNEELKKRREYLKTDEAKEAAKQRIQGYKGKLGGDKTGKIHTNTGHINKLGKIQGKKNSETGHLDKIRTFDICSKGGKTSGNIAKETGQIYKIIEDRQRVILVYKKDTGEFIGEFKSQAEASRVFNLGIGNINKVLNGLRNHTGGYTFKYKK
jgi:hypothetical protein